MHVPHIRAEGWEDKCMRLSRDIIVRGECGAVDLIAVWPQGLIAPRAEITKHWWTILILCGVRWAGGGLVFEFRILNSGL